jgi:hypothetical protein
MAGKVGYLKVCGYNFTFVFRHRFEKVKDENDIWDTLMEWRDWELGFWFKRWQIVGQKNFHILKEWDNNLVYEYMIGVNLLWCKAWFTVNKGGMSIDVPKEDRMNSDYNPLAPQESEEDE